MNENLFKSRLFEVISGYHVSEFNETKYDYYFKFIAYHNNESSLIKIREGVHFRLVINLCRRNFKYACNNYSIFSTLHSTIKLIYALLVFVNLANLLLQFVATLSAIRSHRFANPFN